jgi:hypothetical protein
MNGPANELVRTIIDSIGHSAINNTYNIIVAILFNVLNKLIT